MARRLHETCGVAEAISGIKEKKRTKEQYFGRQKHPHAQLGDLALLAMIGKLRFRRYFTHFAAQLGRPTRSRRAHASLSASPQNYVAAAATRFAIQARLRAM